jgi:hypothetical protein
VLRVCDEESYPANFDGNRAIAKLLVALRRSTRLVDGEHVEITVAGV